jgi:hypothetical protein
MRLLIDRAIPKLAMRTMEMTPLNTNEDTKVLVDGSALETVSDDIVDTVSMSVLVDRRTTTKRRSF